MSELPWEVFQPKLLLDDLYGYGYWALADGARRDLLNEGSDNLVEQAHTVLSSSLTQPQPFKLLRPALHGTQGYHHRTGIHSDRKICAQKALRLGWDVSRPGSIFPVLQGGASVSDHPVCKLDRLQRARPAARHQQQRRPQDLPTPRLGGSAHPPLASGRWTRSPVRLPSAQGRLGARR